MEQSGPTNFGSEAEPGQFLESRAAQTDTAPGDLLCPPDEVCEDGAGQNQIVVTGSRITAPSITKNQQVGVDEGDLVRARGDTLVILRRGRLFTVSTAGGGLRAVDSIDAYPPGVDAGNDWYDEMLVSGDRVVVIGYSSARGDGDQPVQDGWGWAADVRGQSPPDAEEDSSEWDGVASPDKAILIVAPVADGPSRRFALDGRIGRIEVLGEDALVVSSDEDVVFTTVVLGGPRPLIGDQFVMTGAEEAETRSHAFFYRPDAASRDEAMGVPGPAGHAHGLGRGRHGWVVETRLGQHRLSAARGGAVAVDRDAGFEVEPRRDRRRLRRLLHRLVRRRAADIPG